MVTTTLYTLSRGVSLVSSSLRRTQMSMTITLGEIINIDKSEKGEWVKF